MKFNINDNFNYGNGILIESSDNETRAYSTTSTMVNLPWFSVKKNRMTVWAINCMGYILRNKQDENIPPLFLIPET